MKVDHVVFSTSGGAGIAARRIVEAQSEVGIDARLHYATVGRLGSSGAQSPWLIGASAIDQFVLRRQVSNSMISVLRSLSRGSVRPRGDSLLHLHWLPGAVSVSRLSTMVSSRKVLMATLHDMWLFSGGCHFSAECTNFKTGCHECPIVRMPFQRMMSNQFEAKRNIYSQLRKLVIVSPSKEILESAAQSSIFPQATAFVHIPNPVDRCLPITPRLRVGNSLLPEFTIGVIADNLSEPRKNVQQAVNAFRKLCTLSGGSRSLKMVLIGRNGPKLLQDSNIRNVGFLDDIAKFNYQLSSIDLLWSFSRGEVFPNTVTEAAVRGIPSVLSRIPGHVFASGGGFAYLFESQDHAIQLTARLIDEPHRLREMATNARRYAESLAPEKIGARYREVYAELIR